MKTTTDQELLRLLRLQLSVLDRKLAEFQRERRESRTQWEFAREALSQAAFPMRARDLAKRMRDLGWETRSKNPTAMLVVTLKQQLRRGNAVRPGRGLWGLREWLE